MHRTKQPSVPAYAGTGGCNKTTSVTTDFKKLTTGNNVFIVSVIVYSNCHILQVLHQMFTVTCIRL